VRACGRTREGEFSGGRICRRSEEGRESVKRKRKRKSKYRRE
jgi:hypothetical protein